LSGEHARSLIIGWLRSGHRLKRVAVEKLDRMRLDRDDAAPLQIE
jgi:hypothetical protein